jgi:hypothetical protein
MRKGRKDPGTVVRKRLQVIKEWQLCIQECAYNRGRIPMHHLRPMHSLFPMPHALSMSCALSTPYAIGIDSAIYANGIGS